MILTEYYTRIRALLVDASSLVWASAQIDEAIRQALAEYQAVVPFTNETIITCPADGREIALNEVTGLLTVSQVWWPYTLTGSEVWPPNRVKGYSVWWDDGRPVLFIDSDDGDQPQLDDSVRLWYTKAHTIQNLDSASTTTPRADHESALVIGAAGYAAIMRFVDRTEGFQEGREQIQTLEQWGFNRLRDFRRHLSIFRAASKAGRGDPFGSGWKVDKWDK